MASSGSAPSDVKKDSNPKMNKEEVNKKKDVSASLENEKLKKQEVNKDKDAAAGLEIDQEEVSSVKKKRKRDEDASGSEMNKEEVNKEKDVSASLENEKLKKQEANKEKDASAGLEIDQEEVSSVKKKRKRDEDASGSEEASRIQAQEERKKKRLERRRRNTDKHEAEAREWNWKGAYEQALRSVASDNAWLDNEKARINRLKELKKFLGPNTNLDIQEIHDINRWDKLNEQRKFRETNPEQNELAIRELACSALKTWQGYDNVFDLIDKELEPESESE